MKHTRGEWIIDKSRFIIESNNKAICRIIRDAGESFENAMADAKLIAAAPDLLEAGKAILNYAHDDSKFPDVEAKVYAAIKKATE